MALYAETSAVLAWLFGEPEGTEVRQAIDSAERVVTSVLTSVEVRRAVMRAEAAHRLPPAHANKMVAIFDAALAQWDLMEIDARIRARSSAHFPIEPVRTLDAIHLATALEWARVDPSLSVLSLDQRIIKNLRPLGLRRSGSA